MTLSPELQSSLESKIKQFEEERTMPLVSKAATANSLAEFKQSLAKIQ